MDVGNDPSVLLNGVDINMPTHRALRYLTECISEIGNELCHLELMRCAEQLARLTTHIETLSKEENASAIRHDYNSS